MALNGAVMTLPVVSTVVSTMPPATLTGTVTSEQEAPLRAAMPMHAINEVRILGH
jgi:hypothetical protein